MRNLAAVIMAEAVSGPGKQSGSLCSPGAAELPFEATAEEQGRAQQGTHATSTAAVLPNTRTINCLSTTAVQGLKWLPPKFWNTFKPTTRLDMDDTSHRSSLVQKSLFIEQELGYTSFYAISLGKTRNELTWFNYSSRGHALGGNRVEGEKNKQTNKQE